MIYDHMIKRNGKYYMAGEDVPEAEKSASGISDFMNPPVTYTKTEINRMSTAELKSLATEQGIENAEDMTGAELKKILIDKFC